MIEIKPAKKDQDFKTIENLARIIFHEVYDPILPLAHTDYFLNAFQTAEAIKNQVNNDCYFYYLLCFDNISVGYLAIQKLKDTLILSKIYILKSYRGNKIGKAALDFASEFATNNRLHKIELTVNQQNHRTIEIYKSNGYTIREHKINTFDDGYSVNDYIMEKILAIE